MQQMKTKPRRLTEIALLTALALIIFLVEAQIPVIVAIPGIKLGLANMVVLFAIFWLGKKEALLVLFLRIFLGTILVGQVVSLAYSLTGGLLSFLVMGRSQPLADGTANLSSRYFGGSQPQCGADFGGVVFYRLGAGFLVFANIAFGGIGYWVVDRNFGPGGTASVAAV